MAAPDLDSADRQLVAMALAHLAVERPGWDWTLRRLAALYEAGELFDEFKWLHVQSKRLDVAAPPVAGGSEGVAP